MKRQLTLKEKKSGKSSVQPEMIVKKVKSQPGPGNAIPKKRKNGKTENSDFTLKEEKQSPNQEVTITNSLSTTLEGSTQLSNNENLQQNALNGNRQQARKIYDHIIVNVTKVAKESKGTFYELWDDSPANLFVKCWRFVRNVLKRLLEIYLRYVD